MMSRVSGMPSISAVVHTVMTSSTGQPFVSSKSSATHAELDRRVDPASLSSPARRPAAMVRSDQC